MVNWHSNVFPGILGRTCDRPCEPACRRGRVEENNGPESMREKPEPVAICRLKCVAAHQKGDVRARMPKPAATPIGQRSTERRVGEERASTGRLQWAPQEENITMTNLKKHNMNYHNNIRTSQNK